MSKSGEQKNNILDLGRAKPSKKQGLAILAVLFMPLSLGLIGVAIIHSVSPATDLSSINIFSLSTEFRNALLQGVLAGLGFIGIMVFFYLGKIHESDKDFIDTFHTKNLNKSTDLNVTLSQVREGIYDWKLRIRTSVIGTAAILAFPVIALVVSQESEPSKLVKSILDLAVLGSIASGGIMIGSIWDRFEDMLKILNSKLSEVYDLMSANDSKADGDSNKNPMACDGNPTNPTNSCNKDAERDKLIFDLVTRRLDSEWQRINDLDTKATNLIGFISVVVGLLLGAGTFKLSTLSQNTPLSVVYFIGVGLLLVSIGLALGGFKVRKWHDVPNTRYLIDNYTSLPYDEVLKRNAGEMANVVTEMEITNNKKARLINTSWYLLISGLSVVFIFIILFILTGEVKINGQQSG